MKKIMAAALALGLCAGLCFPALAARTELTVNKPDKLPAVGETFTVTVDLSGNTGLKGAQLSLLYNKDVVKCTDASVGEVLDGTLNATNPLAVHGPSRAIIAAATADGIAVDGELASFTFTVIGEGNAGFALTDVLLAGSNGVNLDYTIDQDDANPPVKPEETAAPSEPSKPAETVKPTPTPVPTPTPEVPSTPVPVQLFSDLAPTHWAAADVSRAVELGIVNGYADGSFMPDKAVTRAEFVTMLWKLAGSPAATEESGFSDVAADSWYAPQIAWAKSNHLVGGMTATEFAPNGQITREQAMTILFRQAGGVPGVESMFGQTYDDKYIDSDTISDWARPAIHWGIYHELIKGVTENTVAPKDPASRAQTVAILLRNLK